MIYLLCLIFTCAGEFPHPDDAPALLYNVGKGGHCVPMKVGSACVDASAMAWRVGGLVAEPVSWLTRDQQRV